MGVNGSRVFSGKTALVIGGSGGIGKAVCLGLAERGAGLVVHGGSSAVRLETTLAEIREKGGAARGFLLNIDGPEAVNAVFEQAPDPDILVCAWGPFQRGPLETADAALWQKMAFGNFIFPGILVSRTLPVMFRKKFGRILLFGGTNTDIIRGYLSTAVYSAAKTALGVVARSAAMAVTGQAKAGYEGRLDITCNVICPGLTDTEYLDGAARQYNRERSPGGVPLEARDIAGVCIDVMENSGINGAVIPVDRGICL